MRSYGCVVSEGALINLCHKPVINALPAVLSLGEVSVNEFECSRDSK